MQRFAGSNFDLNINIHEMHSLEEAVCSRGGEGGAGFVPYMGYIGLCVPKWVWFLSDVGLKKDTDVVHLV